MPRPNPEETYRTYVERYDAWNGVGNGDYPFSIRDKYREWSGTNSPNFPRSRRFNAHHVFVSNLLGARTQMSFYRFAGSTWDKGTFVYRNTSFTEPSGGPPNIGNVSHIPGAREAAIGKAMDEVQDRKVNLAQFIAERQQLVNSVTDVVNRLTKAIHCVRRRDVSGTMVALGLTKRPKKFTGNVAKDWLAVQYGWKPLLSDVKGMAEFFADKHINTKVRIRVRKKVKLTNPPGKTRYGSILGVPNSTVWNYDESRTDATCILRFVITNDFNRLGGQLGISDPLTLAWELIPYSFVVDWFLPVGNFIARLNYDSGLTFEGGSTTQWSFQTSTVTVPSMTYVSGGMTTQLSGGTTELYALRFDREVHLTPPQPTLPHWKDPFSWTHLANALALMRVGFSGRH